MICYLALRKTPAQSSGWAGKFVAWLIKARLVSEYCHGGILVGELLAHATPGKGVHLSELETEKWALFSFSLPDEIIRARIVARIGKPYDWFSLLAFAGFKARDRSRLYCFELCYELMTGLPATKRVTAETLLALCMGEPE